MIYEFMGDGVVVLLSDIVHLKSLFSQETLLVNIR